MKLATANASVSDNRHRGLGSVGGPKPIRAGGRRRRDGARRETRLADVAACFVCRANQSDFLDVAGSVDLQGEVRRRILFAGEDLVTGELEILTHTGSFVQLLDSAHPAAR